MHPETGLFFLRRIMANNEYLEMDAELQRELWKVPVSIDLIEDTRLSSNELRFYLLLMGYARSRNTCFPARETMANILKVSIRTIDRYKIRLKELGLLKWTQWIRADGRLHNKYTLCMYRPIKKIDLKDDKKGNGDAAVSWQE